MARGNRVRGPDRRSTADQGFRAGATVQGLTKLRREMRKMQLDLSELDEAHRRAAQIVAAAAVAMAPVRSGALRGTIRPSKAASRARVSAGKVRVPYAGPIHWGWPSRGIESNPFMTRAAEQTEPLWLPTYTAAVDKAVSQVVGARRGT